MTIKVFTALLIQAEKQSYFSKYAAEIDSTINIPIILVGGNRSCRVMSDLLENTNIKYFSLSRPLIREPDLINKWKIDPTYKPKCISCNQCWTPEGNFCIFEKKES